MRQAFTKSNAQSMVHAIEARLRGEDTDWKGIAVIASQLAYQAKKKALEEMKKEQAV